MFLLTVLFGFRGGCGEALLFVAIMRHVLQPMVKLEAENDMKTDFLKTENGDLSICGDEELV
jgi:hypothetical protein